MISSREMRLAAYVLKNVTGIDATICDLLRFSCYVSSFKKRRQSYIEAKENWMIDSFGLGEEEISTISDFAETPEFKQYCQNYVQEWRDERELI